jgi:trehalose utilization protein
MSTLRVTVWNEGRHAKQSPEIAAVYPTGIHRAIAEHLAAQPGMQVRTATLDEPERGLTDEVLANTDVLTWWGHMAHGDVSDGVVDKVQARVLEGMGLIVLHSGHFSKIFRRLMGTNCSLIWREMGEKERVWTVSLGHPIVEGLGPYFEIPHTEMYGELFDIPQPDELVFISWYPGGEVFRSGCTTTAAAARSSTSPPATRPSRSTIRRRCGRCLPTRCAGPRRSGPSGSVI